MSAGGNSGSGTTIQEIPQWLQAEYQQNIDRAENVANKGFSPYGGQLTAGDNSYLQAARDQAVGSTYAGQGQVDQASKIFGEVADQSPYLNQTRQLAGQDLSAYQNPYEDQVVKQTLDDIDLQRDRQGAADNANTPRGAFGGSRQGVGDALRDERFDQQKINAASTLRQAGYDRATTLGSADVDRQTNADQFNTGIDQANTAANLQGAQGLLGVAGQKQNMALSGSQALSGVGSQLQGQQQSDLDAQYTEFMRQQQNPIQGQQLISQAVLGINNAGGTTTTNSKGKGLSL